MVRKNKKQTHGTKISGASVAQGDMEAKREMARRLLEGDSVEKDEEKAVSLLEDCVAHGDADAMVLLAQCCALGVGMEHNAERAEALLSDAAEKGNDEARILMKLINDWKEEESVDLWGLQKVFGQQARKGNTHIYIVSAGFIEGDCTIEHVTLVMNIVPCRDFNFGGLV